MKKAKEQYQAEVEERSKILKDVIDDARDAYYAAIESACTKRIERQTEDTVVCRPQESMVFVELVDGAIELSITMSNDEADDTIGDAIDAWATNSAYVIIEPCFTVSAPVDYLIEGNSMPLFGNAIDESARPTFDAMRRELIQQVERIDALTFMAIPKG